MTCIANYATKKAFKEAVEKHGPEQITIEDPSLFAPYHGSMAGYFERSADFPVTNHPKRSWFARVVKKADGTVKVT